jgi:hypothetical protein
MIIGNKESFAVQWQFDEQFGGTLLLGRICFWVGGSEIGEYNLGTSLTDVLLGLKYIVHDCGNRNGDRFCSMDAKDVFVQLHNGLFESDATLASRVEEEMWARFDVSLEVDVFDSYKIYLLDCRDCARLLVGRFSPNDGHYLFLRQEHLRRGEFDEVVRALQGELEAAFESSTESKEREGDQAT